MKKIFLLICALFVTTSSFAILEENELARKRIKQCSYEFVKIKALKVKNKGIKIRSVNFELYLKITNKSDGVVALDRATGKVFLDTYHAANFEHKKFFQIKPGEASVEKFTVDVPFTKATKKLSKLPKKIIVDAKIFLTVLIGERFIETPIEVPVKESFSIPYKSINKEIKKKLKKNLSF